MTYPAPVDTTKRAASTEAALLRDLFSADEDLDDAVVFVPRARVDDADADRVERARGAVKRRVRQWLMGARRG